MPVICHKPSLRGRAPAARGRWEAFDADGPWAPGGPVQGASAGGGRPSGTPTYPPPPTSAQARRPGVGGYRGVWAGPGEGDLDMRELLGGGSPSVSFCRAEGWSMRDEGVHDGDVVVDQATGPETGPSLGAAADGELTVLLAATRTTG